MRTVLFQKLAQWRGWDAVWGMLVLLLPLTSVPVIVKLVHSDVVAAPSALVLPFLVLGWALPRLITGKKLPEESFPMILFVLAALFCTVLSFFRAIPEFKNHNPISASLSAIITLGIGFCFYFVSLLRHDSEEALRFTFKLLNISGAIVCLWTLTQAFFWYKDQRYPEWMKEIQFQLSVGSLYRQRFVGFTLEPSWLAHQLNLLYLPWWFAASVSGCSAFRHRGKFITIERVLFCIGMAVLFLTLSRVGLAAFLICVFFCGLVFTRRLIQRLTEGKSPTRRRQLMGLAWILIFAILGGIALLVLFILSKLDFRMANLFNIQVKGRSDPVFYLAEKLSLAARFVYWDGGLSIFNQYPLTGVGLGHAGFYLPDCLNEYAYRLIEVQDLLFRSETLLNIKSLWVRILAECGILGFSCFFIAYLRQLLSCAVRLRCPNRYQQAAAWMGCFTLLAFILEGFSLDTFALPYFWFSTGLAAAGSRIGNEA